MFVRFSKRMRLRSAVLAAMAYLLCVLTPAAAFTLGDGSLAAHCLTDVDHSLTGSHPKGAAQAHFHDEGSIYAHASGSAHAKVPDHKSLPKESGAQCCGLICFSALPATEFSVAMPDLPRGPTCDAAPQSLAEYLPPLLFRPPASSLTN